MAAIAQLPTAQRVQGAASHPVLVQADGRQSELPFFTDFAPGSRVLDVGCGTGVHLKALLQAGMDVVGVEYNPALVSQLEQEGLPVVAGSAESLPFESESFDAVICSVVLPYVDERQAIQEWARVLKPGGRVCASYHGLGYGLQYLLWEPGKRKIYGARMLLNTAYYSFTGRRLPGCLGDTHCQCAGRLSGYYRAAGLALDAAYVQRGAGGLPKFLYHRLHKQPLA